MTPQERIDADAKQLEDQLRAAGDFMAANIIKTQAWRSWHGVRPAFFASA